MLAIEGASGAGKSTLLHILGTLDRPSDGQVFFQGQDLFARSNAELAQLRNREVGFVFQFHHLLPEFSALENTMMPGLIQGMSPRTAARFRIAERRCSALRCVEGARPCRASWSRRSSTTRGVISRSW